MAGLSEINISPKIIPPYCKVMMPRCFLSCTTFNNILYTIELLHVYAGSKRLSITISHSKRIKVNCSKFIMFCLGFYSKAMTTFLVVTDQRSRMTIYKSLPNIAYILICYCFRNVRILHFSLLKQ